MKLSTRARYAVMAAVELAGRERDAPLALAEIAARQEISLSYLEQLVGRLRRAGVVRSVRGPGGGYALSRRAEAISVADVIHAVEEPARMTRCAPERGERGCLSRGRQCGTHDLWEALGLQVELFLCSVSLADVAQGRLSPCDRRPAVERMPAPDFDAAVGAAGGD